MPHGDAPVLVFGGTGFLGRAVVRCLAEAGNRVRVAARRPGNASLPEGTECLAADIRSERDTAEAVEGARAVINTVALYTETRDLDFHAIHVDGAARLARQARAAGVRRLVQVSGIGADADSASPYVRARALGEQAVQAAMPGSVVVRPSVLFGRGDSFLATLDAVTRLPVIPLFGDGGMRLQPVHVDDAARACALLATRESEPETLYELGGADVLSYRAIVEAVLRHRGRRRLLLPVPFLAWHVLAAAASPLPSPPITRDQLALMATDNVADTALPGFDALGLQPAGLRERLPECLPALR